MHGNGSGLMVLKRKGARSPRGLSARGDEREELHKEIGREAETTGGRSEVGTKVACPMWRLIQVF